jgi:hypothetical protein
VSPATRSLARPIRNAARRKSTWWLACSKTFPGRRTPTSRNPGRSGYDEDHHCALQRCGLAHRRGVRRIASANFFVLSEGGSYRVVASKTNNGLGEVGTEALYLLHQYQKAEATALLDWKRDLVQKEQVDDPLGGSLFARLWTTGQSRGPQATNSQPHRFFQHSSPFARPPQQATNATILICSSHPSICVQRTAHMQGSYRNGCSIDNPTQPRRWPLQAEPTALSRTGQGGNLYSMPKFRGILTTAFFCCKARPEAEAECVFPPARRALRIILDSGYALADDYNMFAGLSLFDDQVDRARRKRGGASTPIRGNVQRPP